MEYISHESVKTENGRYIYSVFYETSIIKKYRVNVCDLTWNCQMSVIGGIEDLLEAAREEDIKPFLNQIKNEISTRPLLLMDLNKSFLNILKSKIDPSAIIMESSFVSTNDNIRYIIVVNIDNI